MLGSFKTEHMARKHLKTIEAYKKKNIEVVFENEF